MKITASARAICSRTARSGAGQRHGAVGLDAVHLPPLGAQTRRGWSTGRGPHTGNSTWLPDGPGTCAGNPSTSSRATVLGGHQVGLDARLGAMPSAVAGPTAATEAEPKARASRSSRHEAVTALTEVKTTQLKLRTSLAAARRAAPPSRGSVCSVRATLIVAAPAAVAARRARPAARGPHRATTTVRPARGPSPADDRGGGLGSERRHRTDHDHRRRPERHRRQLVEGGPDDGLVRRGAALDHRRGVWSLPCRRAGARRRSRPGPSSP